MTCVGRVASVVPPPLAGLARVLYLSRGFARGLASPPGYCSAVRLGGLWPLATPASGNGTRLCGATPLDSLPHLPLELSFQRLTQWQVEPARCGLAIGLASSPGTPRCGQAVLVDPQLLQAELVSVSANERRFLPSRLARYRARSQPRSRCSGSVALCGQTATPMLTFICKGLEISAA